MDAPLQTSPTTSCELMNAAFGLDEMLQDAHFRCMDADMEALEQDTGLLDAVSSASLDFDALSAFLNEMEQLEQRDGEANANKLKTNVPATGSKKKKLSSSKRAMRDKLALQATIAGLQLDLDRIARSNRENCASIHERWKPIIQNELCKRKRVEATRRRLGQMIDAQWGRASQMIHLIHQLRELPSDCLSLVHIHRPLPCQEARDAAIYAMLERKVELKHQLLEQTLQLTNVLACSSEVQDTNMSADGKSMDMYLARLVPFSVAETASAAWTWGQSEYADCHVNMPLQSSEAVALKQELGIMDHHGNAMTLTLRAVFKQFSHESRAVLHWEGTCDWSRPSEPTITTHESGWVIFRPSGPAITAVQSLVHITSINPATPWMECMRQRSALAKVVLPSSEQAMAQQHQSVENALMDGTAS